MIVLPPSLLTDNLPPGPEDLTAAGGVEGVIWQSLGNIIPHPPRYVPAMVIIKRIAIKARMLCFFILSHQM